MQLRSSLLTCPFSVLFRFSVTSLSNYYSGNGKHSLGHGRDYGWWMYLQLNVGVLSHLVNIQVPDLVWTIMCLRLGPAGTAISTG